MDVSRHLGLQHVLDPGTLAFLTPANEGSSLLSIQPIDGSFYERATALCSGNHPSLDVARLISDVRTTVTKLNQPTDICFSFGAYSSACTGSQAFWFVRATSPSSSHFGPFSFSKWTILSTMSCRRFSSTNPFPCNAWMNHTGT